MGQEASLKTNQYFFSIRKDHFPNNFAKLPMRDEVFYDTYTDVSGHILAKVSEKSKGKKLALTLSQV